jgi:hypothetical protein
MDAFCQPGTPPGGAHTCLGPYRTCRQTVPRLAGLGNGCYWFDLGSGYHLPEDAFCA